MTLSGMSQLESDFLEYDKMGLWTPVFQKLRQDEAIASIEHDLTITEAKKPENKNKNRYRDVNPYDHSCIKLQNGECDYINANLIRVPQANRRYILTQGPLEHTAGHFWQMVWEQNSRGVMMLNRVIEKGTVKCYQYWPLGVDQGYEDEMYFDDVGLKITLVNEFDCGHFIWRTMVLENLETNEAREVLHFHYITWPDFGVPSSPLTFLSFLMAVRKSGSLSSSSGPPVIHCSAGIGRSGTFCLVDTCLILIEKSRDMNSVDVKLILLYMRHYRIGLIQTADQLRFSYLAIIEGGRNILKNNKPLDFPDSLVISEVGYHPCLTPPSDKRFVRFPFSTEQIARSLDGLTSRHIKQNHNHDETAPPVPPKRTTSLSPKQGPQQNNSGDGSPRRSDAVSRDEETESFSESPSQLRKRLRGDRKEKTKKLIQEMKEKQQQSEIFKGRKNKYLMPLGIAAVVISVMGLLVYRHFEQN